MTEIAVMVANMPIATITGVVDTIRGGATRVMSIMVTAMMGRAATGGTGTTSYSLF